MLRKFILVEWIVSSAALLAQVHHNGSSGFGILPAMRGGTVPITSAAIGCRKVGQNGWTVSFRNCSTVSVFDYGAKCDFNTMRNAGTDDTAAFQAAATAVAKAYRVTGPAQLTYNGNCLVAGVVTYGSGVGWYGANGMIYVVNQSGPTFKALDADNVSWDSMTVTVLNSNSATIDNPFFSVMQWISSGDGRAHTGVAFENNTIHNSNWGILVEYFAGSGAGLSNVVATDNTVDSPAPNTNYDGIHFAGRIDQWSMAGNKVTNRGNGALSVTSERSGPTIYTPTNGVMVHNTLLQNRIGIDLSGPQSCLVEDNYVVSRALPSPAQRSNPAFRAIYYNAPTLNCDVTGNTFTSPNQGDDNAKLDDTVDAALGGTGTYKGTVGINFRGNTYGGHLTPSLYVRGSGITINNETFPAGGQLFIDYNSSIPIISSNIVIGPNTWLGSGTVRIGGNASYISNVQLDMPGQKSSGAITYHNSSNTTIPNGRSQSVTVAGCSFANSGNNVVCSPGTLNWPQRFTDTNYTVTCSKLSPLVSKIGDMPVIDCKSSLNGIGNFVPSMQAHAGSAAGFSNVSPGTGPTYGITYTFTGTHP